MKSVMFKAAALALLALAVGASPAAAGYIDPNTRGMLFQLLAALFAAASGVLLLFSSRIRMGLARLRRHMRDRLKR
jgi:hypothetical protein